VLLHGATGSWLHWIRNIPPLAGRFQVLVPDLPGYGDSDMPPEPQTAEGMADIVSRGLDALVPSPRAIEMAGFSMGGIVAGLVAARQGDRVRTLVLVGPNGLALPAGSTGSLRRVEAGMTDDDVAAVHRHNLGALMFGDAAAVDTLAVHVQRHNARTARFKSGDIPSSDVLLRALPGIRARLAGIWGERDAFALPHLDERRRVLAGHQADLDFRVIPGAGHWAPYEAAERVTAAILEILGGAGTSRGAPGA
jgi:pimeloyl-ACP methyl ester carboxylesterase